MKIQAIDLRESRRVDLGEDAPLPAPLSTTPALAPMPQLSARRIAREGHGKARANKEGKARRHGQPQGHAIRSP